MLKAEFTADTAEALNAQIKDYLSKIKGSRGGKAGDSEEAAIGAAPAPLMPPGGQPNMPPANFAPAATFAPPAPGAAPGGAFPAPVAPAPGLAPGSDPTVANLAERISKRLDAAIASGQPAEAALGWVRNQLGPNAANYTMDQCKQSLVTLPAATLTHMAGLMAA